MIKEIFCQFKADGLYIYSSKNLLLFKLRFETKSTILYYEILLVKSSENNCFLTCILPDYVANEIFKEFWKNAVLNLQTQ